MSVCRFTANEYSPQQQQRNANRNSGGMSQRRAPEWGDIKPSAMGQREKSESPPVPETHCVQVSNVSPQATREQLYQLFAHLGRIEAIQVAHVCGWYFSRSSTF
jgi:hypothetical protein